MCGEQNIEKNSEFQMGIEPTNVRTLEEVNCPRNCAKPTHLTFP